MANEIWLKFDENFHNICGHWEYSVNFFHSRLIFRKQHKVIEELWKKYRLGEAFLFPYKKCFDNKLPKLEIRNHNENNPDINNQDNSNKTLILPQKILEKITWFDEKLNPEQKSAVINILKGEGRTLPYIIYGPPGTGKTITLTESIFQVFKEFPKSR